MRIGLKLLVVTVILTFSFVSSDWIDAQSAEETVQNQMQHANAFYWLGMVEKGNIDAFHQGIEHLKQAASLLNSASLPPAEKEKLDQAIRALRTDLNNQIYIHQNHFYAVFPLARLLTPSFFVHSQAASTFEMMRDPQEKAVSLAGEALRDEVVERWAARPQLDVVITSIPPNKALENNLSFIFSSSSRFSVHNYWEVAKVLPAKELAAYRDGMITPEIQRKLCEAFSIPDILLVSVSKLDKVDKNFFYLLKGRIYNLAQDETTHTFSKKGMARDRRDQLQPIIITCISLLLIAIVVYFVVVKLRTRKWPSLRSTWPVPILGFAIGLLMPSVLMPMLTAISPAPDELATISFWWPCLVGVTLFLGPVIFYRIASARLNAFTSAIDMTCQGGALCVTIALGVCAYLTGPLFLYLQKEAYQAIFPLSLCSSMALYLIGWFLESDSPVLFFAAIVSSIAIALLGAALLHLEIVYLWIITGTVLVMGLAVLIAAKEVFGGRCRELSAGPKVPENIDDLVSCSEAPSYQEFEFYKKVFDSLKPFVDGKTVWLQLTGPDSAGKTAAASALVANLKTELAQKGKNLVLLKGECRQEFGGVTPYAPFRMALGGHLEANLTVSPHPKLQQFDFVVKEFVKASVPLASLLFQGIDNNVNADRSEKEIFSLVALHLEQNAMKTPTVLFIDDVHRIDHRSRELLLSLIERFPTGDPLPLFILLTARNGAGIGRSMQQFTVELKPPDTKQLVEILSSGLGLMHDVATEIVERFGSVRGKKGELFWLLVEVSFLARKGFFHKTEGGFTWSEIYKKDQGLPIPDTIFDALAEFWNKYPFYRNILVCAACLGHEFNATILSECLGAGRLEVLHALTEIEEKTGIIRDVYPKYDMYEFSSDLWLKEIETRFRIAPLRGPKAQDVPQLILEYHARAATALEKTLAHSFDNIYKVAEHYYASGPSYAANALDYCLKAANMARKDYAFEDAVQFVQKVKECSEVLGKPLSIEEEELLLLLIDCDKAHVKGSQTPEIANKCKDYFDKHPTPPMEIMPTLCRAFYEAGRDLQDQRFFKLSADVGHIMVELAQSPVEKAEGFHFIGISLPFYQPQEREKHLREAYNLIKASPTEDLPAQALLARVANSLAEQLSNSASSGAKIEVIEEIIGLYELSKEIKSRPELYDRRGLALTYGGLGRLYLYIEPCNIGLARENFLEDLKLSQEIGDIPGQSKMYSFLGACDLREKNFSGALKNYKDSYKLAVYQMDKCFSLAGILESSGALGNAETFESTANLLMDLAKASEISKPCAINILDILEKYNLGIGQTWRQELLEKVKQTVPT